ncbi:MAG: hypothetical protein LBC27_04490 [Spirochaetaceae bacterium]|jgi:tetratricopeptide (TPR) repeat protein|nr:hypothetical protein [Spirochaetaceae bacterium]
MILASRQFFVCLSSLAAVFLLSAPLEDVLFRTAAEATQAPAAIMPLAIMPLGVVSLAAQELAPRAGDTGAFYEDLGGADDDVRETGEDLIAKRYFDWAQAAFRDGRFSQAEASLIRASDYAPVSSDLSYLLAVVKKELSRPLSEVLTALRLAIATKRWDLYSGRDARLLEAEILIQLCLYDEALEALSTLGEDEQDERGAELRIRALRYLPNEAAFNAAVAQAFDRYPYSPVFPRILFSRELRKTVPSDDRSRALVDLALKRLPALLKVEPSLIRFAAPFISDTAEARRLLSVWRSDQSAGQSGGFSERQKLMLEALPVSLETGLIDEETAINELFANNNLDSAVLFSVWELLRTDAARDMMSGRLLSFSGVITGDSNDDGVIDSRAEYNSGSLVSYSRDADQDGVNELSIVFEGGWPVSAEIADTGDGTASIVWGVYPALSEAVLGETRYFFRPMEFNYPAVSFETLGGTGGILLPEAGMPDGGFNRYLSLNYAYLIERPGRDFAGGVERIECKNGVVFSAKEYLDGRLAAETSYENGSPVLQRIDLDLDGRLETVRRFSRTAGAEINLIESDWDGDGFVEYRETQ